MNLSWSQFFDRLFALPIGVKDIVYGIPKGGMIAAGFLASKGVIITHRAEQATVIIDDIVDSGITKSLYSDRFPSARFLSVVYKEAEGIRDWVTMPWETDHPGNMPDTVEQNVTRILQYIGEDPARPGLEETPKRVVRSWGELFEGYKVDIPSLFKTFDEGHDEMIILKDIRVMSMCEHHMLPFIGTASVGYIPTSGRVLGLSKIARIVNAFSRRLQVQENLTRQIAEAINEFMAVRGVGVVIRAKHLCMSLRGIKDGESEMVTSCLLGTFRKSATQRSEFLNLIGR